MHVHSTVAATTRRAFPNLLYTMRRGYSLNVSASRALLTSSNPDVFHWYASECSFEHADLRRASLIRANRVTAAVRKEPRPPKMSDAKWLGGHPPGWPYSGCNPSRFRPYPLWPPSPEVHAAIMQATEHYPGSERFVYFGHGPTARELEPALAIISAKIAAAGGADRVSARSFHQLLTEALGQLSPARSIGVTGQMAYQLRRAEAQRKMRANGAASAVSAQIPDAQQQLLRELLQARLSVEAFAQSVSSMAGTGLRGEYASRDRTYYFKWV